MPTPTVIPVAVSYTPNDGFTFTPDAPLLAGKKEGDANYVIVFTLTGAAWAPGDLWMRWSGRAPQPLPAGWDFPPLSDDQRAVGIANTLPVGGSLRIFNFEVNVDTPNGRVLSLDPDIVLDPPSP